MYHSEPSSPVDEHFKFNCYCQFHVCGRAPYLYTTCRNLYHHDHHYKHVFIELGRVSPYLHTSRPANYNHNHHYEFYEFVIRGATYLHAASTADDHDNHNHHYEFVIGGATDLHPASTADNYDDYDYDLKQ